MRTLIHADVYRTESLAEVADLALAELVEEDAVALVEWGDLAAPAFGESALEVTLVAPDPLATPEERVVAVVGRGRWAAGPTRWRASSLEPGPGRGGRDGGVRRQPWWPLRRRPRRSAWPSARRTASKPSSP